jgi:hypothetical protein
VRVDLPLRQAHRPRGQGAPARRGRAGPPVALPHQSRAGTLAA